MGDHGSGSHKNRRDISRKADSHRWFYSRLRLESLGRGQLWEIAPGIVETGGLSTCCTLRDLSLLGQRRIEFALQRGQFAKAFHSPKFLFCFQQPRGGPTECLIAAVPAFHVAG